MSCSKWVGGTRYLQYCDRSTTRLSPAARGDACPHRIRIYANHPDGLDFDDAEVTKPHHDMSLLESEIGVTEYPLRVSAFVSVNSLTLFFVRNPAFSFVIPALIIHVRVGGLLVGIAFFRSHSNILCRIPRRDSRTSKGYQHNSAAWCGERRRRFSN